MKIWLVVGTMLLCGVGRALEAKKQVVFIKHGPFIGSGFYIDLGVSKPDVQFVTAAHAVGSYAVTTTNLDAYSQYEGSSTLTQVTYMALGARTSQVVIPAAQQVKHGMRDVVTAWSPPKGDSQTVVHKLAAGAPNIGERVSAIGHPWAGPAKVIHCVYKGYLLTSPALDIEVRNSKGITAHQIVSVMLCEGSENDVSSGLSGGPVFNEKNEVVGVVSQYGVRPYREGGKTFEVGFFTALSRKNLTDQPKSPLSFSAFGPVNLPVLYGARGGLIWTQMTGNMFNGELNSKVTFTTNDASGRPVVVRESEYVMGQLTQILYTNPDYDDPPEMRRSSREQF